MKKKSNRSLSEEINDKRENQMEMIKLNNVTTEMNRSVGGFKSRTERKEPVSWENNQNDLI